MHPLGPSPNLAQLPPQARLPGEGGGATTFRAWAGVGEGRAGSKLGAPWVPLECVPSTLAPTQMESGEGVSVRVLPPAGSIKPVGSKAGGAHRSTPPQEDAAGQRRALRQQLQQVHRERTGRLRALGAR